MTSLSHKTRILGRQEIAPLMHKKRTTPCQPCASWHPEMRTGSKARPVPCPWAFLVVSFLCNVGAPCWGAYWDSTWPVSSNPSSLPLRPFSSTPWTPSQQFFGLLLADMNYPLILPRKSACLAVPSPMSVFLLLSSLHRHHPGRNDSQEQRKKQWGRKGER